FLTHCSTFHKKLHQFSLFSLNGTPSTIIFTLSLHDALPICRLLTASDFTAPIDFVDFTVIPPGSTIGAHQHEGNEEIYFIAAGRDRKSTRLNSSHVKISYAVFCLTKKNDRQVGIDRGLTGGS